MSQLLGVAHLWRRLTPFVPLSTSPKQANLGAETKEEFLDLVANGNLRTPYIPKQPEEYYKRTREWISWDHFLRGCFDDRQPSEVQPSFGVFD